MTRHARADAGLTKNQTLVMGTLSNADGPLSAYTILDQLRDEGFRAPPQVYRALDRLVEAGLAHRLESLNAFIACRDTACGDRGQTIFMICETCGKAREVTDRAIAGRLDTIAAGARFTPRGATVELRGICGTCQAA